MAKSYIKLFFDWEESADALTDAEKLNLIRVMVAYASGNEYEFIGNERFVFPAFKTQLDRDNDIYETKCRVSRENGSKSSGRPRKPIETEKTDIGFSEPKKPTDTQEKDKEERIKTKKKDEEQDQRNNISYICSEPLASKRSKQKEKTPSEYNIPLNDGTEYNVPLEEIELYKGLYKAIDVEQEIRRIIGWCYANERKRKTRKGIGRFINAWLSKAQDGGGRNGARTNQRQDAVNRGDTPDKPKPACAWDIVL